MASKICFGGFTGQAVSVETIQHVHFIGGKREGPWGMATRRACSDAGIVNFRSVSTSEESQTPFDSILILGLATFRAAMNFGNTIIPN